MRNVWIIVMLLSLVGCATTGGQQQAQIDRITPEELAKLMPPPVATLSLDEIVALSKAGNPPEVIIEKIKASNSRYDLTPQQVLDLGKQGVDTKVLDYIHQANELAKQNAIADEMNKREKEKQAELRQLRRQRDLYYDPFWRFGPPWMGPIGPAGRYWRGGRFGWGVGYGYPFWW